MQSASNGDKPFYCKFCGLAFQKEDGLKEHIQAVQM